MANARRGALGDDKEFEDWVSPRDLMIELGPACGGQHNAAAEMDARLKNGLLKPVARSLHTYDVTNGEDNVVHFVALEPPLWRVTSVEDPADDFWAVGRIVVRIPRSSTRPWLKEYTFFDVRFGPEDVTSIPAIRFARAKHQQPTAIPTAPKAVSAPKVHRPPKIDRSLLEAWIRDYGATNPDAPFQHFFANAKLQFPAHQITQRPVRDAIAKLGLTKSRGNPAITRKNRVIGDVE